jgi:signal transduction histidine kinase
MEELLAMRQQTGRQWMRFPPPVRFYAPLLVLVFGLATTWLEYELNLANDLARSLKDVEAQAAVTGDRLTRWGARQAAEGDPVLLAGDFAAWVHQPWLKEAALVDGNGVVIDDSGKQWKGHLARETTLAPAMDLAANTAQNAGQRQKQSADGAMLFGAYPFAMGSLGTGWALIIFDRADAVAQAHADAIQQLRLAAAGITLICIYLWAALHFGFAVRLARLSQAVRDFGEGRAPRVVAVSGGDEVQELSAAFATMAARLDEREAERRRLEREVLETTERERQRIGQDLHDSLGQQLTAASLAINGLITRLESAAPALAPQAENLGRQLRKSIAEVRVLSHGLAPVPLEDDGLMHALQELAETTSRSTGVRCAFECPQPVRVPDSTLASHLYRIAQEAVNNALKHAAPREIRIGLERHAERLVLEVDDDGEGLADALVSGDGIGHRVMRHRALLIGGTCEIGSSPAGGTRMACNIPSSR